MDTPTGGGRDSRFNMGYQMSLLSGDTSPEIYGSRPSTSLSSAVSRSSMSLPSTCGGGIPRAMKRSSSDVCFEDELTAGRSGMSSQGGMGMGDCGSDMGDDGYSQTPKKTPPPNGKKTKGRVKIKMEYIDNKLRRYTTFSKRKTGIMKKAYELSTLTGTQVMLLVASETGHVYTFATRKLQPMITSEAGKALIQTCLNSPDPPPSSAGGDQRMSATGFEETELTYNIGDEEQKEDGGGASPRSDMGAGDSGDSSGNESPSPAELDNARDPIGSDHQSHSAAASSSSSSSELHGPGVSQAPPPHLITAGMMSPPYSGLMYQTAQGMVYAAPTSALPNGVIFSLGQGQLQHLQQQQQQQDSGGRRSLSGQPSHQFITIPLPMALASNGHHQEAADLSKNQLVAGARRCREAICEDLFPTTQVSSSESVDDSSMLEAMRMGCGTSKRTTAVVPLAETKGSPVNLYNNTRRTSDVVALQGEDPPVEVLKEDDLNSSSKNLNRVQPTAFEVPVNNDSLIRKHPPKRLQRLEDQQVELTHQLLDERQAEAEQRRKEILIQRVQSAKQRPARRNFDLDGGSSTEDVIETIKRENSSVEL